MVDWFIGRNLHVEVFHFIYELNYFIWSKIVLLMRLENSFCLIFLEEFPTFLNCLSFTINGYIYQQTTGERERERERE